MDRAAAQRAARQFAVRCALEGVYPVSSEIQYREVSLEVFTRDELQKIIVVLNRELERFLRVEEPPR